MDESGPRVRGKLRAGAARSPGARLSESSPKRGEMGRRGRELACLLATVAALFPLLSPIQLLCCAVLLCAAWAAEAKLSRLFAGLGEEEPRRPLRLLAVFGAALRDAQSHGLWLPLIIPPLLALQGSPTSAALFLGLLGPAVALLLAQPFLILNCRLSAAIGLLGLALGQGLTVPALRELSGAAGWVGPSLLGLFAAALSFPLWAGVVVAAPKSFTLGEVAVLGQLLLLIGIGLLTGTLGGPLPHLLKAALRAGVWATVWLVTSSALLRRVRGCGGWWTLVNVFVSLASAVCWVTAIEEPDLVSFAAAFLVAGGKRRLLLLLFWAICLTASLAFVCVVVVNKSESVNSIHRKFFHLTAGLVLVSGLRYDPELTHFASAAAACAMVVFEVLRVSGSLGAAAWVESGLRRFVDRQDEGPLLLTPLYLLLANFLPLWLWPVAQAAQVQPAHYAGLISVGFCDSFAAVAGLCFGTRKWGGAGGKTLQGTLGGAIAGWAGLWLFGPPGIVWSIGVAVLLALLETFSSQIDNLALPLVAFVLLL